MNLRKIRLALWGAVGLAAIASGALYLQSRQQSSAPAVIGSLQPEFDLPDTNGKQRTSAEFRGKYLLVFFGFTNCPDVCPTTMTEVADVMDALGADAARVQPIFISIDPVRDTELGLGEYVGMFHPSILGLAGSEAQTKAAAESFRIHFSREADPNAPDGYTMSHSPALYLVGPDGEWLRQYGYGTPAAEITQDLQERL
ncbi:SCO family protein [Pseudogemmobacter bohemicus]|uniref:SCO family protein n=1 Tax=Pseudogemmobacter bohemicus TaxID=2250708 RepID=UPI000DD42A53|nr:SCO family protein [Pseudogemmobacter bohemicus]